MKKTDWKDACRKIGQICKEKPTVTLRYDVSTGFFRAKEDVAKNAPAVARAGKGDFSIDLIRASVFCGAAALLLLLSSRGGKD